MSPARRWMFAALIALLLPFALGTSACDGDGETSSVAVMTRNLYLGADLDTVLRADADADLLALIDETWLAVVGSDIPARMDAVAEEIAAAAPDLVGLQEAMRYELGGDEPLEFDFVRLLLGALAERGLDYDVVVEQDQFGGSFPTSFGLVTLADRDVILARAEADFGLSTGVSGQFDAALEVPNPLGGTIRVVRGWTAVDVTPVDGAEFRFINVHLEAFDEAVRVEQTRELLEGSASTAMPVVLVGDLNSPAPDGAAYELVRTEGEFADAWGEAGGDAPGLTCCWSDDLRGESDLGVRIDLVLHRGDFAPRTAEVVGDEEADRFDTAEEPAGLLWPSDHAGVVVTLELPSD